MPVTARRVAILGGARIPCHQYFPHQAGRRAAQISATGAIILIQRFGSAANLNIHLNALVLDGVYCTSGEGAPVFNKASAPSNAQLKTLLDKIINRIMKLMTYQRSEHEQLCRYVTRPAIVNERPTNG